MKLTWYGHSCFLLETAEGSAVFDPYAPGSVPGWLLPELTADCALCSHGHNDHNWAEGVTLTGKTPAFKIETLDTWHDGARGTLRGANTIRVVEAEGHRFAHLGDFGHELSAAQLAALGRIDVLMLPVGGFFTIDAAQAARTAEAIGAPVVIPMHYRGKDFGYDRIGPVEDFLALRENVVYLETNVVGFSALTSPVTLVPARP